MNARSRRQFFQTAGLAAAAGLLSSGGKTHAADACCAKSAGKCELKLGLASYSTRKFNLDQTIQMTQRAGLKYLCLKSVHLPLESTAPEIQAAKKKIEDAGLILYGGGVISIKSDAHIDQALEYAKTAGMTIINVSIAPSLLNTLNQKVPNYNIRVAIHNHGPTDNDYPTPVEAYEHIKNRNPLIGLCMDIGHTVRVNKDPAQAAIVCKDRLYDVHYKDVNRSDKEGSCVEAGRGIINIPAVFKTLQEIGYAGIVSLEYEKDASDPLPGIAESIGYARGVWAAMKG